MTHAKKSRKLFNRWVIILLVLVVVVSIAAVAIPWGDKDKDNANSPKPTPTLSVGLTGNGALLATLLGNARNHTFHAKYSVKGDPALIGGSLALEWWNKPGHSRVDATRISGSQTVVTASIINGAEGANCTRVDSGDWTCRTIPVAAPGDPSGLIGSLTAQLAGRSVSQSAGKVGGRSALCFHVEGGTEPIDVCVNANGVMLKNASSKIAYEATTLDENVTDAMFNLPAPVR